MLLVVSGLPGTGKTTVADAVALRLDAVRVSVDPVEEALLASGLPPSATGVAAYEAAAAVAQLNLATGHRVVADAVNDSEDARDTWRRAAVGSGAALVDVVLVLADEVEHRRRLDGRRRPFAHVPEPSWDDVRARAAAYAPWPEGTCFRVDAAVPVARVVGAVLAHLR